MIATLDGVQFGYDDAGTGTAVVLLHGFPHDRTLWSEQVSAMSTYARCIVPDLRGFGQSSGSRASTIDEYADDVAALLTHLDVERAVVCGLSMGGYVAMAMWRRHPERVCALVLCDTKAGADTDDGRRKRDSLIATARESGSVAVAALQLPGMVGKTTRERRPDVVLRTQLMMERASVDAIVGALSAMRDRPDSVETLGSVTVPVLVVVGDEDVLTPVAEAQRIMDALPPTVASQLEIVDGSGHVTPVERPSAVTHILADFLATLPVHS